MEVLRLPPLRWYLTGFLVPEGVPEAHEPSGSDEDEEFGAGDDETSDVEGTADPDPKQRPILPSSLGLTVLLPDASSTSSDELRVGIAWGEYRCRSTSEELAALCRARGIELGPDDTGKTPSTLWERVVPTPAALTLDLSKAHPGRLHEVTTGTGLKLEYRVEAIPAEDARVLRIGDGSPARAVSVFLVNARTVTSDKERQARAFNRELNENTIFQVQLSLEREGGFLPRPDVHFGRSEDFDDRMVDLQFRAHVEWAVGHGVATQAIGREPEAKLHPRTNPATRVCTAWIPKTTVAQVQATELAEVVVEMDALAQLADPQSIEAALGALPRRYAVWIADQRAIELHEDRHRETRAELMRRAEEACERIRDGIELLKADEELRRVFAWVNHAMAEVARRKRPGNTPRWRLFQLAFLLLNLRGITEPKHRDRRDVELLFFPTGGGKTEAYLGVIATVLLLRRLRGRGRPDEGLGVAVILRYTLRLLTLDQLERASALICSLELLRREHVDELGAQGFAIGLWVGSAGTPNTMAEADRLIQAYRGRTAESKGSPFPLTGCPWCGTPLEPRNIHAVPVGNPKRTRVTCANATCEFSSRRTGELPVLFVDEQIYRELPDFVVSTVDKFAMLTHRGETGKLFGKVHSYIDQRGQPRCFYGGGDGESVSRGAEPLPQGLLPPELIVQDELHLISGPLGTMVGLFETMVEELCRVRKPGEEAVGPKIIAATATVRRASTQVQALYGRPAEATRLFPPQGVDAWETFFARRNTEANERMYVGLGATGRSLKRILLQSYLTLLGASERIYGGEGERDAADPYKTVVGYFNSLRELGGMRRLVDDEVQTRVRRLHERAPFDARTQRSQRWLKRREIGEPIELTSRISTTDLVRDKARLETKFSDFDRKKSAGELDAQSPRPVDVALASNMISVGVDITRLGLMVVAGQPKTTSEYIQASSRVGRDDARPGLVVTIYNVHKPRDRSYYEHFVAYHESFYRYVEAQSVTPFSLPALDRGLASVFVGLVRHLGGPRAAAPLGAALAEVVQHQQEWAADVLAQRARQQPVGAADELGAVIRDRSINLAHKWRRIVRPTAETAGSAISICYSPFEMKRGPATKSLLRTPEDDAKKKPQERIPLRDDQFPFVAPTSLRDVEPSCAIWIRRRPQKDEG